MISEGLNLHVYDIAKSKVRKSFSMKSKITSFAVNHCDAYIAAGCSDGSLNLVTLASNQLSSPMVAPKCAGQKVTSVKYSSVKVGSFGRNRDINVFIDLSMTSLHSLVQVVRVESSLSGTVIQTRIFSTSPLTVHL